MILPGHAGRRGAFAQTTSPTQSMPSDSQYTSSSSGTPLGDRGIDTVRLPRPLPRDLEDLQRTTADSEVFDVETRKHLYTLAANEN